MILDLEARREEKRTRIIPLYTFTSKTRRSVLFSLSSLIFFSFRTQRKKNLRTEIEQRKKHRSFSLNLISIGLFNELSSILQRLLAENRMEREKEREDKTNRSIASLPFPLANDMLVWTFFLRSKVSDVLSLRLSLSLSFALISIATDRITMLLLNCIDVSEKRKRKKMIELSRRETRHDR